MLTQINSLQGRDGRDGASATDLVTGMQLLRAANIQTIRLQLAMLRGERRPALGAIDSLTAMDGEIERFIDTISDVDMSADEIVTMAQLVDAQKRALATEKLALVAGISGPVLRPSEHHVVKEPVDESGHYRPSELGTRITAALILALMAAVVASWMFQDRIGALIQG